MCMNTLYGKTMAIWMLAGRPLAAIIFFLAGFVPSMVRHYRKNRRLQVIQVDNEIVKPVGKYRI